MRFAIVVVAGLIGWLWFATREPDQPAATPSARARRADLSAMHAQVAAARHVDTDAIGDAEPSRRVVDEIVPAGEDASDEVAGEVADDEVASDEVAGDEVDEARDTDVSGLLAQLEAARAAADDDFTRTSISIDGVEVDGSIGHEIIVISGAAPIIETTAINDGYTINIPTGRTFGSVLGAAADSQGQEYGTTEGVTFSGGTLLENTYYVDGIEIEGDATRVVEEPEPPPVIED